MKDRCSTIKIMVYRLGEDDPRKSTGVKLLRFYLATKLSHPRFSPRSSIVLDPTSPFTLDASESFSTIIVVDRSWKKLLEDSTIPRFPRWVKRRRLPRLIAANPINYGKQEILSSAEAVAATLYIIGCEKRALEILGYFKWGLEFLRLNKKLLEVYAKSGRDKGAEVGEQEREHATHCGNSRKQNSFRIL